MEAALENEFNLKRGGRPLISFLTWHFPAFLTYFTIPNTIVSDFLVKPQPDSYRSYHHFGDSSLKILIIMYLEFVNVHKSLYH